MKRIAVLALLVAAVAAWLALAGRRLKRLDEWQWPEIMPL